MFYPAGFERWQRLQYDRSVRNGLHHVPSYHDRSETARVGSKWGLCP
ncbi:hypothetical protein SXCC_04008 [Gluconacetobacter sp. SXCC-1]|nr:hypothetical protein SXCC_04008 [Gluconacetobacter sp. SXCC-1]